ncbi:molybdopterin molybdotransferase MoeA [Pseudarthrobacter sp. NamE2]|uniref:molybdopterin molybdotransferase MoeA n=1 Tax=Pseudarthrobacter sp. NamE2 TaxID=2576838 RepID=UPI0010FE2A27|nr:gephyrin-like molybdotransferase Glp [Pseudarthrobacter sp. NamE2]TLM84944.1 molybdopterin molybdotransferase MoeA [Pseudarthrobacter sp. NamE2]
MTSTHPHAHHDGRARSIAHHLAAVTELLRPVAALARTETVPLSKALGRGLVHDVMAPLSLPPFANSQMDGYAIRCSEVPDGGAALGIAAPVPAGASAPPLGEAMAAPIMTGAMMPAGADAVVPIERAIPDHFPAAGEGGTVTLPATVPGTFVRAAGSDIAEGERALAAGTFLGPPQLGLLAALGIPKVTVYVPVTVLLVATGDEVVEPGRALPAGKIYDSNGTLLEAAMTQAGLQVRRAGIITDNPDELRKLLRNQGANTDLIVTTGGVSKGAYEVVRQAMTDQPVDFMHVEMQPGGPQGIGTFEGIPFLGFPGNPVSCLVSFEMFLRPALSALLGTPAPRVPLRARLHQPLTSPGHKHQVRRGTLCADGTVRLEGGESSHLMHALAASNALVHVPAGVSALAAGDEVEVWML